MKIFYGVQGTGNGHITRARVMAKELANAGIEVDYLFTGRPANKYFDMEIFNEYQTRQGLTFHIDKGQVNYLKTVIGTKPFSLIHDIKSLNLDGYDLIISDFEPVTAWAAKLQKKPVLGIGHQYAFAHKIPRHDRDPLADWVMKMFAPATTGIGLHWHHFDQPILPPIIDTHDYAANVVGRKIVVYLPFEDQNEVMLMLAQFNNYEFHIYSPDDTISKFPHIKCKPLSRNGFQMDVFNSEGVICNAGFELASEALYLGKRLLVKPVHEQMEQLANAKAIQDLYYGHVMHDLDMGLINKWLNDTVVTHITYPNIAKEIVNWIQDGMPEMDSDFINNIWRKVYIRKYHNCSS